MIDLVLSLKSNKVKLTAFSAGKITKSIKDAPESVLDDTKILDNVALADLILEMIPLVVPAKNSKLNLNIAVDTNDAYLGFVTITKTTGEGDLQQIITTEVQKRLGDLSLETLYFSFQKIAPFVYQYIAMDKGKVETLMDLANNIGISLKSVIPWVYLLPKYAGENEPSIFVCGKNSEKIVVLSELGGVFYANNYGNDMKEKELAALVKELSAYGREEPIKKLYHFNYELGEVSGLDILELQVPNSDVDDVSDVEINTVVHYMLDIAPDLLNTQANILNLMPVPVVKSTNKVAVYAGVATAFLFVGGVVGGGIFLVKTGKIGNFGGEVAVLSETSVQETPQTTQTPETQPAETPRTELKKEALSIRIENGSSINGAAGKLKTQLEALGYKVNSIDTALDARDTTLLSFATGLKDYSGLITTDFKDKLGNVVIDDKLSSTRAAEMSDEYNVLIILGSGIKLE